MCGHLLGLRMLLRFLNHWSTATPAHGVTGRDSPAMKFGGLLGRQEIDLLAFTATDTNKNDLLHGTPCSGALEALSRPRSEQNSAARREGDLTRRVGADTIRIG